jgi:hypothetical protein
MAHVMDQQRRKRDQHRDGQTTTIRDHANGDKYYRDQDVY